MNIPQRVRPYKAIEIEKIAESIIQRFQPIVLQELGSFEVENFFENELYDDTNIAIAIRSLPNGISGCTDAERMECTIAEHVYDHKDNLQKKRYLRSTLAHEIGHCYLHIPDAKENSEYAGKFENDGSYSVETFFPENLKAYEDPEWQAWRFASALLMPELCFRRAIEINWTKRQIQNAFDVNSSFVDVRMRQLKITKLLKRG